MKQTYIVTWTPKVQGGRIFLLCGKWFDAVHQGATISNELDLTTDEADDFRICRGFDVKLKAAPAPKAAKAAPEKEG